MTEVIRNADKFIKCYILDISEDYKSAFQNIGIWRIEEYFKFKKEQSQQLTLDDIFNYGCCQ